MKIRAADPRPAPAEAMPGSIRPLNRRSRAGGIIFALSLTVPTWFHTAWGTSPPALDVGTHAVVARDTMVCQSPWQVLEGRECRALAAGRGVSVVRGDSFSAAMVGGGTQRCWGVGGEVLPKP